MIKQAASSSSRSKRPTGSVDGSDGRYSEFLRNSTLGVWRCDLEKPIPLDASIEKHIDMAYKYGHLSEANDMMAKMYGLRSGKQLVGTRLGDLLPRDNPKNQEYLKNFVAAGYQLRDAESQEIDAKGNTKYFLNSLIGIIEDDMLTGVWGTQLDVTRLHETATALRESEAKLKLTLEASGVGIWEWGIVSNSHSWSHQLSSIFGSPKNFTFSPERYYALIHPDDRDRIQRVIGRALKERRGFDVEHRILWPNKSVHWILCRGQTIYDESRPVRMLGTCMNIDKRKESENLLLQTMKLDQEKQKLMELNEAKDEFIALASHQLRTPATSVKQYLGILLEGVLGELDLTEGQKKILKAAYESNERQINIVNDLLLIATLDAGKMKLNKRPVDIGRQIRDIMKDSQAEHDGRTYEIKVKAVDEPLVVMCDYERIRMAFENVISNAFKYSPDDSTVTIEITRRKREAVVRVIDRGVGFEKKDMSKLFQKFSRINNPMSISSGGTGLGLYWTKKIIMLHDGTIEASSQPKKRTVFAIHLPL